MATKSKSKYETHKLAAHIMHIVVIPSTPRFQHEASRFPQIIAGYPPLFGRVRRLIVALRKHSAQRRGGVGAVAVAARSANK